MKHRDVPQTPGNPGKTEPQAAEEEAPGNTTGTPQHDEWLLDEALRETFPASDPIAPASAAPTGSGAAASKQPARRTS
jgi:hypothetical protein